MCIFVTMHSRAFADIDTIPSQGCRGSPGGGHRPGGDPGGYPGAARGRFWGCGITQSTPRSRDIDKVHKNKVVGHYQFKKKNDVCFDVRGCVIEIWKRSFPQHAQHAFLGAQLPWLSNVRKTK